ncbi:hypothetical protein KAR91_66790, partial [Candidatus Pacearchaeota archaeon]|nr:hypothetical protein [Candidatus Pacearchaeota archaeon]
MKNILLILCLIFSLSASAQFGGSAWGGSASRAALAAVEEKTGAKDHDASKSYKEGDLVWYNSALYRCKADIIAKAWDVADWDEITGTSEEFWQRIGTVISTLNPNDSVGIGIADAKTNLHVLTSGTSGLASIVEGRGVVITGIGGQSRLYFESPSSNTGERVSMLNFQDGKLSVSSLGDNGGSFVNVDIFTVKYDGNVGVNIADPATSLHVKHNSSGRDFSSIFSHVGQVIEGSESAVLSLTSSNTGTSEIWFDDSDSTVGGTSGRIRYEHAINAMKLLVNNGTVVTMLANGNVGIGDINPTEKLVVKANQGRIRVDTDTADTAPGFELAEVGVRKWISYNAADDSFRIKGLGNDVITVTQSENVGVGKVDPIFKLEVQTVAGGDPISWRNPTYKLGELSWGAGNDAGWIGLYNDGNRVVEIDANGFSYLDGPGAEFAIGENNPEGLLEVSASGSTAKDLFLLSSDDGTDGDLFIVKGTGEVGIGTNAPGAGTKLHVKSSTLATIVKIENASTTGETAWQLQNDSLGAFATLYGSVYPTASLRNNLVYVGEDGVTLDFLTE